MSHVHSPYCDRSAALGEGFPSLVGGVVGLGIGLLRGSVIAARRIAEEAIWMDTRSGPRAGCAVHRVVISDAGPCACASCSSWWA